MLVSRGQPLVPRLPPCDGRLGTRLHAVLLVGCDVIQSPTGCRGSVETSPREPKSALWRFDRAASSARLQPSLSAEGTMVCQSTLFTPLSSLLLLHPSPSLSFLLQLFLSPDTQESLLQLFLRWLPTAHPPTEPLYALASLTQAGALYRDTKVHRGQASPWDLVYSIGDVCLSLGTFCLASLP